MRNKQQCCTEKSIIINTYLSEFRWRQRNKQNDLFEAILNDIKGFTNSHIFMYRYLFYFNILN